MIQSEELRTFGWTVLLAVPLSTMSPRHMSPSVIYTHDVDTGQWRPSTSELQLSSPGWRDQFQALPEMHEAIDLRFAEAGNAVDLELA
jgi:hypothetical protein